MRETNQDKRKTLAAEAREDYSDLKEATEMRRAREEELSSGGVRSGVRTQHEIGESVHLHARNGRWVGAAEKVEGGFASSLMLQHRSSSKRKENTIANPRLRLGNKKTPSVRAVEFLEMFFGLFSALFLAATSTLVRTATQTH